VPFLELIAVFVTLAAVYLTTRQSIWCWPLGMVSVTLYALVFYEAKLYADMGLQGLYFALAIYGWWAWLHGGEDHGELRVSLASTRTRLVLLALGAVGGVGLGLTLHRHTDASLPYLDSLLTSFSIVGQWMQTRKLLESWLVWLAVDVVYVGMFLYKGLIPTAGLYAVFLVLAVRGFVAWRRSMGRDAGATETQGRREPVRP
jgi:nicotinamide mononucleotide transporter